MTVGLVIACASYPVFKWPVYQRSGPIGFVPRIALLALLPEISSVVRDRMPRGTPYGDMLAYRLSEVQPLNKIERFALARSIRRVLCAGSWKATEVGVGWGIRLAGDQAGEFVEPLITLLSNDSAAAYALGVAASCERVRDERFRRLITPVRSCIERGSMPPRNRGSLPERIKWWGGSKDDYSAVALAILRESKSKDYPFDVVEFIWRNDCVSAQDLCLLQNRMVSPAFQTALAGTLCLADLGPGAAPVLDEVIGATSKPTSTLVSSAAMVLMSMGSSAQSALPWLDGLSNHRNPLIASSAFLAALSIRGESEAAYAYWLACIEDDSEVNADAPPHQWMTPLILYANIPKQLKVEGLLRAIKRDQKLAARSAGGVSGGVAIATDCLGKLGAEAILAVPDLVQLIQPGMPDFFVERVLDTLTKLRGYGEFDASGAENAVNEWSKTAVTKNGVEAALGDLKAAVNP